MGLLELYLAQEGGTRKADAQKLLDALRESGASPLIPGLFGRLFRVANDG